MGSTQITVRTAPPSPQLARRLKDQCEVLSRIHPEVRWCRVDVEGPGSGAAVPAYRVTLRVALPGEELAFDPEVHPISAIAVNRAFALARRRLRELKQGAPRERRDRIPATLEATR